MLRFFIVAFFVAIFVAGCSTLRGYAIDKGAPEKIAKAIDAYCDNVTHPERVLNRDALNAALNEGNTIVVTCAGDPE